MTPENQDEPLGRIQALLEDESLRGQLLPQLDVNEIGAIRRLLHPVSAEALKWCEAFPILNPALVLPASIGAIVPLARLPVSSIGARAAATLLILALDDLFDSHNAPPHAISETVRECIVVAGSPFDTTAPAGMYAAVLARLKTQLAHSRLWHDMQPLWAVSLARLLEASTYEYWCSERLRAKSRYSLPPFDEYFYFSCQSIAFAFLLLSDLILQDDQSSTAALEPLLSLAEKCAVAVRIANDLATADREHQEQVINSLTVLTAEFMEQRPRMNRALASAKARRRLSERINLELDEMHDLANAIETQTHVEQRFVAATKFAVNFYRLHDLRDWVSDFGVALSSDPRLQTHDQ